jgi:hypothetical protein
MEHEVSLRMVSSMPYVQIAISCNSEKLQKEGVLCWVNLEAISLRQAGQKSKIQAQWQAKTALTVTPGGGVGGEVAPIVVSAAV